MTDQLVKDNERVDDLQNGYYVIQDPDKFCFGMDAVLLSGFAKVKKGEIALDMGTGTGIIPILLKAKTSGKHFTGLEIQQECADMAGRSVMYNHLENDVDIVQGDIKEAAEIFGAASFDVVTSNPPYMIGQHGLRNPDMPKAIARHEVLCNLEDVVSQAAKVLKERGRFYMVHRPFRLAEIMNVLTKYRLEPKRMQLVYPYIDREPNMVLIEALKGGNSRVTVEPPLIVYKEPGVYTENILKIYEDTVVANGHEAHWDYIHHDGAAAVLPVTDDGKILMVRQYRNALDRFTLEIPAGKLDEPDEPKVECAYRELEEETGVKGLPLQQLRTWGAYDRDPRWRVITTSFLALTEGDLPVRAGDDAADALWMDVSLRLVSEEDGQQRKEIWELCLDHEERKVHVAARVERTYFPDAVLPRERYRLLWADGLAVDHGCIITQALLYLKERLEERTGGKTVR